MPIEQIIKNIAELEYSLWVVNTCAAGIQQKDGRYITKYFPVSPFIIENMLLKNGSMGCYQQGYKTNRIKWICFDFDCKDKDEPDVYSLYQKCVLPFTSLLDNLKIKYLTEFSGRRGIHVWIIFNTIFTKDLGFRLICELERKCYVFAEIRESGKWGLDRFPATDSSRNNKVGKQVKFPLSCHRSGTRSYLFKGQFEQKEDTRSEVFYEEQLAICKTQEISENRRLIAAVYCQLLQYCQGIYDMAVPKEYLQRLLNIFESIEQISTEATEEEKEDSNVMIIWFLHELKVGGIQSIDDTILQKSILILLQELGRICFIFEIKDSKTGQYIFSIHDMIVKAISTPEFLDVRTGAGIYQIQILQLAVKLFVNEVDKQKVLDKLKNKCNLKFIEYLERSAYIVDSQDLMNYQKNGVMIFYNNRGNKILVRNKDKKYFFRPSLDVEIKLHEEKDYEGKTIGFFVEYELSSGDSLINYSEKEGKI